MPDKDKSARLKAERMRARAFVPKQSEQGRQVIYGNPPSKSNCYRVISKDGHGSLAKTPALLQYERDFYIQCKIRGQEITGYFEIEVDVYYPSQRSDLDNSLKCLLDCLQKCNVIRNDNQCVKITARKFLDKANPRVEFELKEL